MKNTIIKSIGAALFAGTLITTQASFAQQTQRIEATTTTTTSAGTISEFGPQGIVIKTEAGTQPVRYISRETTTYVDENGSPVSIETVKSGLPVTVYYTKVGDTLVASKVMVRRAATAPATIVETTQTTTTSAGTISQFGPEGIILKTESSPEPLRYSATKTTTYVDENGSPVAVETVQTGLPVTVHYTRVGNTLVASKVVVRRAVAAPVIEKKTTTTTTTIESKK